MSTGAIVGTAEPDDPRVADALQGADTRADSNTALLEHGLAHRLEQLLRCIDRKRWIRLDSVVHSIDLSNHIHLIGHRRDAAQLRQRRRTCGEIAWPVHRSTRNLSNWDQFVEIARNAAR